MDVRLAGVGTIEGAPAHREQTHERRQSEGGEEGEQRRLGNAGRVRTDQEQEPDGDQG